LMPCCAPQPQPCRSRPSASITRRKRASTCDASGGGARNARCPHRSDARQETALARREQGWRKRLEETVGVVPAQALEMDGFRPAKAGPGVHPARAPDGGMADRRLSASVARMLARGRALLTLGIAYMRASGLIEPDSCSYVPRRRSRVGARRVSCMPGMRRAAIAGQRKRCESGRGVTRAHAVEEVVEEHSGKMSQSSCTLLHSALCPRVTRAHTVEEVVEEVSQEHTHGQPPWCALRILG